LDSSPQTIEFGKDDIDSDIATLASQDIDKLAFGAIQLDGTGKILRYNAAEGGITGRDPKEAVGKNFFTQLAPCTNTARFRGVFDTGVAAGSLNTIIDYTFDFKMKPTQVRVHMKKALMDNTYWVFVKRV
jgi:photoactive yellow protein